MKTLKSFDFQANSGSKATHEWDVILDGKIRELERGVDYKCKEASLVNLARIAAKKRGMIVKSAKTEAGLVLQAVRASAEQIKAWEEAAAMEQEEEGTAE